MKIFISNISIPDDCFLHNFEKLHGKQIWKDKKGFLYTFDKLHGHVEKWSRTGKAHLGQLDIYGEPIGQPKEDGRSIKNEL